MDEVIARISKVPLAQRIALLALVLILVVAGVYFIVITPKVEEIDRLEARIKQIDAQLVQKRAIARNLSRYRVEVERLKQRLNEALTLLPNEAEIPELLQKIAEIGRAHV